MLNSSGESGHPCLTPLPTFPSSRGVHPPEAMMHFPPVSDFPPVFEIFWTFWKISEMLPFTDKISYFHPPKFLTTFFLFINQKFRIFPLFDYIPPDSRKFLIPLLLKISPRFRKIQQLFTYFTFNFFPLL